MEEIRKWEITLKKEDKEVETVAVIDFLIDEKHVWLNSIEVTDYWKRTKIATLLIQEAIKEFGELYFSTATKAEHKTKGTEKGNRYLERDG